MQKKENSDTVEIPNEPDEHSTIEGYGITNRPPEDRSRELNMNGDVGDVTATERKQLSDILKIINPTPRRS